MAMTKAQKAAKAKAYRKAYYQKNRDRIRAYGKAYYQKNKEDIKKKYKEWEKANPEEAEKRIVRWEKFRKMNSDFMDYAPNPVRSVEEKSWSKLTSEYFESEEDF